MRLLNSLALAIVLTGCGVGQALALEPPHASRPAEGDGELIWRLKPSLIDISKVANLYGVAHQRAVVECVLDHAGRPTQCVEQGEPSADVRMVKAAGDVAKFYRAMSRDSAGKPVEGRTVVFSLALGGTRDL
jgi:hypothetical protein